MTQPGQTNTPPQPDGILLQAESIATKGDDIEQGWESFVLAIEDGTLEVRLRDRKDTIWMIDLRTAEDALKTLKAWAAKEQRRRAES